MNGNNRYLLDTNAVISLLKGNDKLLAEMQSASALAISIISKLEFLCFPGLKDSDKALFEAFTERVAAGALRLPRPTGSTPTEGQLTRRAR